MVEEQNITLKVTIDFTVQKEEQVGTTEIKCSKGASFGDIEKLIIESEPQIT